MTKARVLIAEELSPATVEALGPDFEIRSCDGSDRGQLLTAIAGVDVVTGDTKVVERGHADTHQVAGEGVGVVGADLGANAGGLVVDLDNGFGSHLQAHTHRMKTEQDFG